jgi:hypothetical protein
MEFYYASHPPRANNRVEHFVQIACSLFIWVMICHPNDQELISGTLIIIRVNDLDVVAMIGSQISVDENWRIHFLLSNYSQLPRFIAIPHSIATNTIFPNVSVLYSSRWHLM